MSDWIRCSERMPEKLKSVWLFGRIPSVSLKKFGFEGWLTSDGFVAENNGLSPGLCEKAEVTHWQPLPEPPKEGE